MTVKQLKNHFRNIFPKLWLKDGYDFDNDKNRLLWSGEGAEISDNWAFDFMFSDTTGEYIDGVHHELKKESDKLGIYWEFYDSGTVFAYRKSK